MSISIENINEIERKMTVTIPAENISQEVDKRLKSLVGKVKLDGFRKGKVPLKVVKQRYGGAVHAESVEDLIKTSYFDALEAEKVKPAGMPDINPGEINEGKELTYEAVFEVYPEIELKNFSDLEIEKKLTDLTDADVDFAIEKLRKQRAQLKESSEAAEKEDRVEFDYEAIVDGEKIDTESKENMGLNIGANIMLEGFEDALIGKKAGESFDVSLTFPEDYVDEKLQNKPVVFNTKINKVSKQTLPEINEEFIATLGIKGNLENFKDEVKKNLTRELKYSLRNSIKKEVLDKLAEVHEFKIPKALIKQEAERLKNQSLNYFKNITKNMGNQAQLPEIPLDMFMGEAEKNTKLGLLLSQVIEQNKLEPSDELIEERVADLANMYDDLEEAKSWLMKDKSQLDNIKAQVLEEEAINAVLKIAKITEKQVSYEELMQAQQQ